MDIKKPLIYFLLCLGFHSFTTEGYGQELQRPSEGKALVYFVRTSGIELLENLRYFHEDEYLGRSNMRNYFTYEVEPGEHLFGVSGFGVNFLSGNLEANATYFVEVRLQPFCQVELYPVAPTDEKRIKRINNLLSRKEEVVLRRNEKRAATISQNQQRRFERFQQGNRTIPEIKPNWVF